MSSFKWNGSNVELFNADIYSNILESGIVEKLSDKIIISQIIKDVTKTVEFPIDLSEYTTIWSETILANNEKFVRIIIKFPRSSFLQAATLEPSTAKLFIDDVESGSYISTPYIADTESTGDMYHDISIYFPKSSTDHKYELKLSLKFSRDSYTSDRRFSETIKTANRLIV